MQLFFLLPSVFLGWTIMTGLALAARRFATFIYGTARMNLELHISVHSWQHTFCISLRSSLTLVPKLRRRTS